MEPLLLFIIIKVMSLIKERLLLIEREEEEVWMSYLEWVEDNKKVFSQLPEEREMMGDE